MRVAIISDIHGNAVALEAVLVDLQDEKIDQVVCLGDLAAGGPQPLEALARIREVCSSVVMGNMDAWFLDRRPMGGTSRNAHLGSEVRAWNASQLSAQDLDYLAALPATTRLSGDSSAQLLCYHGSPRSYNEGVKSTTPDEDLEHMLSGWDAVTFAGGHTHTQMVRRHGRATILNPGSVGAPPAGQEAPRAEYGLVCWDAGIARFELRQVPVNLDLVAKTASDAGMPHADWWLESRYGSAAREVLSEGDISFTQPPPTCCGERLCRQRVLTAALSGPRPVLR